MRAYDPFERAGYLNSSAAVERVLGTLGMGVESPPDIIAAGEDPDVLHNAIIFSHPELEPFEREAMANAAAVAFVFGELSMPKARVMAKISQRRDTLSSRVFATLSSTPLRIITKGVELPGPPLITITDHVVPHKRIVAPTDALITLAERSLQEPDEMGSFAPELRSAIERYRQLSDNL